MNDKLTVHSFDWKVHDEYDDNGKVVIHSWCLNRDSKPVLLRFHDFPAFCYVELPLFIGNRKVNWTSYKAQQVYESICYRSQEHKPFKYIFKRCEKLYFYKGGKKYPMLCLLFDTIKSMKICTGGLKKPFKVRDLGILKCNVWESNISMVRKLLTLSNVKYSQWFNIEGVKVNEEDKISTLDLEYVVDRRTMTPIPSNETKTWVTNPTILSFDIETYSDRHNSFPDAHDSKHVVYMVSCVFQRLREPESRMTDIILYGDCNDTKMANVIKVDTEIALIDKFSELVNKYDPDILTGYNILGYDNAYMDTRLKRRLREWKPMGRLINANTKVENFSWSSSAYSNQDINYLDMDGRINIDLLPIIRRDYKLPKYTLDSVSKFFLKDRCKHEVTARQMFETFDLGEEAKKYPNLSLSDFISEEINDKMTNYVKESIFKKFHVLNFMPDDIHGQKILDVCHIPNISLKEHAMSEMTKVVEYCIVDSDLVVDLFEKIHCWISLIQMSSIVGITPVQLFTRGTQIRTFSQIYDEASRKGIIIDEQEFEKTKYAGGFVFDPKPGLYHNIPVLDFMSLYPTVMISHNIDHRTFVLPELMDKVPDEECHVIEWPEEFEINSSNVNSDKSYKIDNGVIIDNIETVKKGDSITNNIKIENVERNEDVSLIPTCVTLKFKYKFVKNVIGIIPTILSRYLKERSQVKAQLKVETDPIAKIVLDKTQLSIKISANSMYGALGAHTGKLKLPPAAACITAKSRESTIKMNTYLESKGHKIVYGDSVTGDTPILCKATYPNGEYKIFFREIQNLNKLDYWVKDDSGKEYLLKPNNLEVWSDKGFTEIKHVMRHKTKKKLYRITTRTGLITVTEDHSLLDINGKEISPNNINVGGKLLTKSLPRLSEDGLKIPHAWVWGLFYSFGSAISECPSGFKGSWSIHSIKLNHLEKAKQLLEQSYLNIQFKIVKPEKHSLLYKLVPVGNIKTLVNEWRDLFYDGPSRYKTVPDILWKCSLQTRQAFYDGYSTSYRYKNEDTYCNKRPIGSAGLFLLFASLGYNVSCYTRPRNTEMYSLFLSKNIEMIDTGVINKIEDLGYVDDYVYDLETENHHFAAGIGELVVHNTDSTMPDLSITDPKKAHQVADEMAKELTALFPPPMLVENDGVFHTLFCVGKKNYSYFSLNRDGSAIIDRNKMGAKGNPLVRRDNCNFKKKLYGDVLWGILNKNDMMTVYNLIIDSCLELMRKGIPWRDMIIIEGLGANYKNKSYRMKIFSDELTKIGKPATPGDRLEYLIVNSHGKTDKELLGYKLRLPETYHERLYTDEPEYIDYIYYLDKKLKNCVQQQLFQNAYKDELDKLASIYLDSDQEKVLNELRQKGHSLGVKNLLNKFNNDKGKVIEYYINETKLNNIVKKLKSYHIVKRRRIVTRVNGEPITMMIKLITLKKVIMDDLLKNVKKIN